jgi:heptosyltransferase-1
LRTALRAGEYDAVLDLQGAIRSAVVGRLAGCSRLVGEAEPRERMARWLFTERVATRGAHVIEQDVELASAVAGDDLANLAKPWLPVDAAAEAWADKILPLGIQNESRAISESHPSDKNKGVARVGHPSSCSSKHSRCLSALAPAGAPSAGLRSAMRRSRGSRRPRLARAGQRRSRRGAARGAIVQGGRRRGHSGRLLAGSTDCPHPPDRVVHCRRHRPAASGLRTRPAGGGHLRATDPSRNGPFGTRFKVLRSPDSRRDHARRAAPEAGLLTIQPEDVLRAADELLAEETRLMTQSATFLQS